MGCGGPEADSWREAFYAAAAGGKTFTQEEVNQIVATDRRKLEEAPKKSEATLQSTLASRNLTEQVRQAVHVLDRFHIIKNMNEVIDEVCRSETR